MQQTTGSPQPPIRRILVILHMSALLIFFVATNHGFFDRFVLLFSTERWFTLSFYLAVWVISAFALLLAALQPNRLVRAFWAFVLSLSTATAFGYRQISSSDLSVFDILSLWAARHEAGLAVDFYFNMILWAAFIFLAGFALLTITPVPRNRLVARGLKWLAWAPAVPAVVIAAIIVIKSGGGSQGMPSQFQPLAVALVAGHKIATAETPHRQQVSITPSRPKPVSSIVLFVDESLRPDYLDWTPGNPYTPFLAANKDRFVNFGQTVSGGNCSSYANAILRMGPSRKDVSGSILVNPTLWQYAKRAGYRTVYIDGQSGRVKDPSKLQNFMTLDESRHIDRHVTFGDDVPTSELDDRVLDTIAEELKRGQPVFIYANKEGAHFPYDNNYPASEARFKPVMKENSASTKSRINSYRNAVAWSVDRIFANLFNSLDLSDTAIIYTSDHGQNLAAGELTHCSTANASPREGLVPLLAITGNQTLKQRFVQGAKLNLNKASHFAISATVLDLMGYVREDIALNHAPSLFESNKAGATAFTSGDIFGLFRKRVTWNPIDLRADYMESDAIPLVAISQNQTSH